MFELVEPIAVVTYMEPEPTEAVMSLGVGNEWDAYFAGRAAPLGTDTPAAVVDALFYNFAPGEVARHIPAVWDRVTPHAATMARQQGSVAALRRIAGDLLDTPATVRAGDALVAAGTWASTGGRALYAAVRTLPIPTEPVARLWHGASLLREHRGDGHIAALVGLGIGGTESHVLHTLADGLPADRFGRLWHLPPAHLGRVIEGLRGRGLIGDDGWLTPTGAQLVRRLETLTDELAAPAYAALDGTTIDQLVDDLEPLAARLATS